MTGQQIDSLVGRHVMNATPSIVWVASKDGGASVAMWTDNPSQRESVKRFCEENQQYAFTSLEKWPPYSRDARPVVEQMRLMGFSLILSTPSRDCIWRAAFVPFGFSGDIKDREAAEETEAMAICRAALYVCIASVRA